MPQENCAYCNDRAGIEDDHVVARQFFPNEERIRTGLPKVPCCPECNREKQRAEDNVGVWFQFGDGSEGSSGAVLERVPRTLAANRRLARELREKTKEIWVQEVGGVIVKRLALELGQRELSDAHKWFTYLMRGLYRYETGNPLPSDHKIHLMSPQTERAYQGIAVQVRQAPEHRIRQFAQDEFKYMFAVGPEDPVSLWLVAFRSIDIAGVTVGPSCPLRLSEFLESVSWQEVE